MVETLLATMSLQVIVDFLVIISFPRQLGNPNFEDYAVYAIAYTYLLSYPLMPDGASGLARYLLNIGGTRTFNIENFLANSSNAQTNFRDNLYALFEASEGMVMDGETLVISTTSVQREWENQFKATSQPTFTDYLSPGMYNYFFLLHNSSASMVSSVTRNGDEYTMKFKYYVDDFYHFKNTANRLFFVTDAQLWRLHQVGLAHEFTWFQIYNNYLELLPI